MPIPLILWGAAAALAATGVFKGVEAKSNFDKAKEIGRDAERNYEKVSEKLNTSREKTQKHLENLGLIKVNTFTNQIKHLVNVVKKGKSKITQFNEEITAEQLSEYEKMVLNRLLKYLPIMSATCARKRYTSCNFKDTQCAAPTPSPSACSRCVPWTISCPRVTHRPPPVS